MSSHDVFALYVVTVLVLLCAIMAQVTTNLAQIGG